MTQPCQNLPGNYATYVSAAVLALLILVAIRVYRVEINNKTKIHNHEQPQKIELLS
jgi:hypothetical protein